jgi:hypothetical protein
MGESSQAELEQPPSSDRIVSSTTRGQGRTVQAFAWIVRPLHGLSIFPCLQSGAARGPLFGTPVIANTTKHSRFTIGQSGLASDRLAA